MDNSGYHPSKEATSSSDDTAERVSSYSEPAEAATTPAPTIAGAFREAVVRGEFAAAAALAERRAEHDASIESRVDTMNDAATARLSCASLQQQSPRRGTASGDDDPDATVVEAERSHTGRSPSPPCFKYVITHRANQKDDYSCAEKTVENFITTFLKRGHKVGPKDGSGIIGATFKGRSRLEQKNVETVTALILDVDGKFKRDGETVIEPVDPDAFLARLPYRGVAHTSYSHKPEHPKFRVILPLKQPITRAEHRRLWYWITEQVEKKADPSCKNPDRMFYLPRCPEEAMPSAWVRELRGPLLSLEVVASEFKPPDDACHDARRPEPNTHKVGLHPAGAETRLTHADGFQLLKHCLGQPLTTWAMENPASVSREVWRGLATNLAAITLEDEGDEQLYEQCLEAFHSISERDAERYRSGDTNKAFVDALTSAKQRGPITYAHMVENGAPEAACDAKAKSPIASARHALAREQSSTRSSASQAPASSAPAMVSGQQLSAVPDSDPDPGDEDDDRSKNIFDLKESDFLHDAVAHKYLQRSASGAFDSTDAMGVGGFDAYLISLGLTEKQLKPWKSRIHSFRARRAFFDHPMDTLVEHDGITHFNTYRPGNVIPTTGDWSDIQALILNLVGGDPEGAEFFLDWLALPLQKLMYELKPFKMGTSVVLQGEQGSGKGTLHLILQALYGKKSVFLIDQDMMDGRFAEELVDKLFVTANEVVSSTNRSMQTANKIKMWVTDPVVRIESKFATGKEFDNNFNIIFSSNDERPVIIEKGDRRFIVFHSKKFDRLVSSRIHDDLIGDKKQVAAFYDALLKRQVRIGYGDLFETEARKQMMAASLSSDARFTAELAENGWFSVAAPWMAAAHADHPRSAIEAWKGDSVVLASTLLDVYRDYCKRNSLRSSSDQKLAKALKAQFRNKAGELTIEADTQRIGGVPQRFWKRLPLFPPGEVIEFPDQQAGEPAEPASSTDTGDYGA